MQAVRSSPFVAQAEIESSIQGLHRVGKHLLLHNLVIRACEEPNAGIALWKNGELDMDPGLAAGLPENSHVEVIVGDWPKVHALVSVALGPIMASTFRYTGRGWVRERDFEANAVPYSIAVHGNRAVVLMGPFDPNDRSAPPFTLHEVFTGARALGPRLAAGPPSCPTRMVPHFVALDKKGRLFVFGKNCEPGQRSPDTFYEGGRIPMVEWFAKGKSKGTLVELPLVEGNVDAYENPNVLEEEGQSLVFSFSGTSRRLRFDGARFSVEDGKGTPLWRVTRTAKGILWAVSTKGGVVRRTSGDEWEEVPLPIEPEPCDGSHHCYSQLETLGEDVFFSDSVALYQLQGPVRTPVPKLRFSTLKEPEPCSE